VQTFSPGSIAVVSRGHSEDDGSRIPRLRGELDTAVQIEDETERLIEVAAIVEEALDAIGVEAVVVGGLAVAYWTRSRYVTAEIDFVAPVGPTVEKQLTALGFERKPGRHWIYRESEVALEFPGSALDGGDRSTEVESRGGRTLRVLSPEDIALWRIREFLHWHDSRGFRHALYILESDRLDRPRLTARAAETGLSGALDWIDRAADEIKEGRKFESWEIEHEAKRLEREG
jgi:hypothetical protein